MRLAPVAVLVGLVACGKSAPPAAVAGDKCTRAYDRLEPLFDQNSKRDRAAELKACREALAKDPGREVWLDCILGIDGELTQRNLSYCEGLDRQALQSQADGQMHVLGKRSAGSASP
jgi:hypothetical protein